MKKGPTWPEPGKLPPSAFGLDGWDFPENSAWKPTASRAKPLILQGLAPQNFPENGPSRESSGVTLGWGFRRISHEAILKWHPIAASLVLGLVGLLGKVFGPIGFVAALLRGTFPLLFGLMILTNDLLWWVPFAMILHDAAKHRRDDQQSGTASRMQYVKETRINAPPEVVFRFHESPGVLQHLIPPWENMEVVESASSLLPGSKVVLRGHLGPFPIRWVAIHTEYDPPHLFADRQESGPFARWDHRHRFLDDGQGGTILRDEVEYQAPLGMIGRWLGGWLIRRKLDRMFAYRHETTRRMIESGESTGKQPAFEQRQSEGDK